MGNGYTSRMCRFLGIRLYVLAALWGALMVIGPSCHGLDLLIGWMMVSTATSWCVIDSYARGRPMLRITHEMTFFTWPVAVPFYLIWSRRFRGLGVAFLHAVGLTMICLASVVAVAFLKYGLLGLDVIPE